MYALCDWLMSACENGSEMVVEYVQTSAYGACLCDGRNIYVVPCSVKILGECSIHCTCMPTILVLVYVIDDFECRYECSCCECEWSAPALGNFYPPLWTGYKIFQSMGTTICLSVQQKLRLRLVRQPCKAGILWPAGFKVEQYLKCLKLESVSRGNTLGIKKGNTEVDIQHCRVHATWFSCFWEYSWSPL